MPHIDIKCYPKHLSEGELNSLTEDLTKLLEQHLHVKYSDVSINYTEVQPDHWKADVWDKEIVPNMERLAKKPGYEF
jgi:4-oxalocrotonate tautomerase